MPLDCGGGVSIFLKDGGVHDVGLTEWRPAEGFAGALAVRGRPFTVYEQELL